jgi:hypothetical protein
MLCFALWWTVIEVPAISDINLCFTDVSWRPIVVVLMDLPSIGIV